MSCGFDNNFHTGGDVCIRLVSPPVCLSIYVSFFFLDFHSFSINLQSCPPLPPPTLPRLRLRHAESPCSSPKGASAHTEQAHVKVSTKSISAVELSRSRGFGALGKFSRRGNARNPAQSDRQVDAVPLTTRKSVPQYIACTCPQKTCTRTVRRRYIAVDQHMGVCMQASQHTVKVTFHDRPASPQVLSPTFGSDCLCSRLNAARKPIFMHT